MFFVFGDSIKKVFVTRPTHVSEGTTKHIINNGSSANHQDENSGEGVRHMYRFDNNAKKSNASLNRRLKEIKSGDTVVLEFGGDICNFDWKAVSEAPEADHAPQMTLADFRELYQHVVSRFREVGAKPVLLSLPELLPQRFFDYVSRNLNKENILKWLKGDVNVLSDWYEQYNQEIFKLGSELNIPVVDITSVFLDRRSLGDCYSSDGMHPNKRGNTVITETVMSSPQLA